MKATLLTITLIVLTSMISACQTTKSPSQLASNIIYRQDISASVDTLYPPKKPQQVVVYNYKKPPHYPYRVIGVASVYKTNLLGMPRDNETIRDMIRKLAASIGGDGVIDFIRQRDKVQASVIAHQQVLM